MAQREPADGAQRLTYTSHRRWPDQAPRLLAWWRTICPASAVSSRPGIPLRHIEVPSSEPPPRAPMRGKPAASGAPTPRAPLPREQKRRASSGRLFSMPGRPANSARRPPPPGPQPSATAKARSRGGRARSPAQQGLPIQPKGRGPDPAVAEVLSPAVASTERRSARTTSPRSRATHPSSANKSGRADRSPIDEARSIASP